MKLIIDIGNTRTKIAVFSGKTLKEVEIFDSLSVEKTAAVVSRYPEIQSVIVSAVKEYPVETEEYLKKRFRFITLDNQTALPVKILYQTPQTLGKDRIALAAAAAAVFPDNDVLVVDAGTTITYDFVNKNGEYLGGGISPGIHMRFKALHAFTGKLPLINDFSAEAELIGTDTSKAIISGVLNGIYAEVNGIISRYQKRFPELKIVLSGGDEKYFDKRLKNNIFALPNFVLTGLNEILDFNEKKRG